MRIPQTKLYMRVAVTGALLVFVLLAELGISSGLVHYGVNLRGGEALGGLTYDEAVERLREREELLGSKRIVFGIRGAGRIAFLPADVSWKLRPASTAAAALEVGREGGPFNALVQRVDAWFGGVEIQGAGGARPGRLSKLINEIEARVEPQGVEVDRARLRGKIKRVLRLWPRDDWYRIPVLSRSPS